MINAINAPSQPGYGPSFQQNEQNGWYFIAFMIIGMYLFKNLFIGVIFREFENAIAEDRAATLLKEN